LAGSNTRPASPALLLSTLARNCTRPNLRFKRDAFGAA
jgi:hypothetical protein